MKIKILPVLIALASFLCGTLLLGIGAYSDNIKAFMAGIVLLAICILCCIIGIITAKEITQRMLNS